MDLFELSEISSRKLLEGTEVRFVHSETMTVAYWCFEAGVPLPEHSHHHDQITNVIEGEFHLTVNGKTLRLGPGSVAVIPPHARHSGKAITECRIIDVFHPVREDYV